ncbi:MAG TPA: isoleucine--tRNA ligase [Candidatus Nanoarchaeia archaeon]|nr:isoleucine--tRNA ligase [Candidatus Nanoarchaeia archaeon]
MKFPTYDVPKIESELIKYWQKNKTVDRLRSKNSKGKKFYFLDGPPYTSGKFHLAHAWNYSLKDIILRYKRAKGFKVWDRNGFDVHGLPTEHKVMDKYSLKTKEDIQKFGVDKFVSECEKFCLEMAKVMTKDLIRMGISFDLSNPYMALKPEFMEGEWDLIKTAWEKKNLYYGKKVLTWCQHCETAIAKHECEYQDINDKSIFVKFELKNKTTSNKNDKSKEFLIIWTTTPWTIPFNLAVMAGPEIDYVKVKVGSEVWILARSLAQRVVELAAGQEKNKEGTVGTSGLKILEEFKGKKLEGIEYLHPLANYIFQYQKIKSEHPKVHTVILSQEYVDTLAGSGLVHAAPGCGPEDQEACKPYNIPPFNNLSENGYFPKEMGVLAGLRAKVDDEKFREFLKKEDSIVAIQTVKHEYPHCGRCKNPVIFLTTSQWFFRVEEIKNKILHDNQQVNWVPDTALNAYESWISNLKDNSISRQRYWGTPVPIWICQNKNCGQIKVIGSRQEIKQSGQKVPQNIHLPWIDKIKFKCRCGGEMKRVPDVIDVWVDAGTASWNCLDNDPKKIKELYPADLILEAREQTRLWFSLLSICSYLYLDQPSFKNVYVYGMLNDIEGKKMSKSLGNIISPYELIDKYGVDVLRNYMCQNNAGEDIKFSWDECVVKQRSHLILWNLHKLLINLAQENDLNPFDNNAFENQDWFKEKNNKRYLYTEEKYILSKLNSTIKTVAELFENYNLDKTIAPLEDLFLELSRTYIQIVREKSSVGSREERKAVVYILAKVLLECLKMFGVIAPFISEAIYLNLRGEFSGKKVLKETSISHYPWPEADKSLINLSLEQEMEISKNIIQAALHAREKAKLGLRWPVEDIIIESSNPEVSKMIKSLGEIIKYQINVKNIKQVVSLPGGGVSLEPDLAKIGRTYGQLSPKIIAKLSSENPKSIFDKITKHNLYEFKLGGETIKISPEMIRFKRTSPEPYLSAESKNGLVYLNTKLNPQLEAEGYSREVMRHLQELRKKEGLQKTDRINLILKSSPDMVKRLSLFKSEIKDKVGAEKIDLLSEAGKVSGKSKAELKVKEEKVEVWF